MVNWQLLLTTHSSGLVRRQGQLRAFMVRGWTATGARSSFCFYQKKPTFNFSFCWLAAKYGSLE